MSRHINKYQKPKDAEWERACPPRFPSPWPPALPAQRHVPINNGLRAVRRDGVSSKERLPLNPTGPLMDYFTPFLGVRASCVYFKTLGFQCTLLHFKVFGLWQKNVLGYKTWSGVEV